MCVRARARACVCVCVCVFVDHSNVTVCSGQPAARECSRAGGLGVGVDNWTFTAV